MEMKHGIIAILIIFLFVGEISALNISFMNGERGKRDFEFSKTIFIKGIEFKSGFLKMPLDGYKTKEYSNIKILSKGFYQKILNCFNGETCKVSTGKKDILIKVEKIFPLKSPLRVANAEMSFDAELIVVFGIVKDRKKKDEIWLSYPKDFEIRDKVFKNKLEKLIKEKFSKTLKSRKIK
ncbi:MAG: hypothetical protein KAI33_06190 [Elusimicrobiales bacterium]|nr:hypothetical protein [Elusimicrobiales bacterium]